VPRRPTPPLGGELDLAGSVPESSRQHQAVLLRQALAPGEDRSTRSILRLEEKTAASRIGRELGVSAATVRRWRSGQTAPSPAHRIALERLTLRTYLTTPPTPAANRKLGTIKSRGIREARVGGDLEVHPTGGTSTEERRGKRLVGRHLDPDRLAPFVDAARAGNWLRAAQAWEAAFWPSYFADPPGLEKYLMPRMVRTTSIALVLY
jgi:transcriptional regulator with XRE-family HTH domain